MIRDMLRREFRRDRFAGLPQWLQVVGWIGVGCFLLVLLSVVLLIPLLLLGRFDLFVIALGLAYVLGISAHLLVHNPFRKPPFLTPGVATRLWVFTPLWIMFAVTWLLFWKTSVVTVLPHLLASSGTPLNQSTVNGLNDLAMRPWQGEINVLWLNTSLFLYFGFYYLFSSIGPRTARPRLTETA